MKTFPTACNVATSNAYTAGALVVPDDDHDLAVPGTLIAGSAGVISFIPLDGTDALPWPVVAGQEIPVIARRVLETGTTADPIFVCGFGP